MEETKEKGAIKTAQVNMIKKIPYCVQKTKRQVIVTEMTSFAFNTGKKDLGFVCLTS